MYIPCTWVHDFPSEKLQVIGESPAAAAWENQNFGAKLKLINPDIEIKTQATEPTLQIK